MTRENQLLKIDENKSAVRIIKHCLFGGISKHGVFPHGGGVGGMQNGG